MDIDGNEIGTIQHHPSIMSGAGYGAMGMHQQVPGLYLTAVFYCLFSLVLFLVSFSFRFPFMFGDLEPSQMGSMFLPPPGSGPRPIPKMEPSEQSRNSNGGGGGWMSGQSPSSSSAAAAAAAAAAAVGPGSLNRLYSSLPHCKAHFLDRFGLIPLDRFF